MELQVNKRTPISAIPSASGLEYITPFIYLIGDDSPWLFKLDENLNLVSKINIYNQNENNDNVIPKSLKPDFEAMTVIKSQEKGELYIFGSGSKSPTRDLLLIIDIDNPTNYSTFSLVKFYALLKEECNLFDAELNIEGAFTDNKNIYLLNRGKNLIIWFDINSFNDYLAEKNSALDLHFHNYELPSIKNVHAGFSGATYVQKLDLILFTASIENTDNWIDDGEVLGSYVGAFLLKNIATTFVPISIPVTEKGKPIAIKIESIAVKSLNKKSISLMLVTDSDGGTSELIEATLLLN